MREKHKGANYMLHTYKENYFDEVTKNNKHT